MRRDWTATAGFTLIGCSVLALLTMRPGLDYWGDSGSLDALVRGDWDAFFAQQPLMGPLSILVRAPFVAPVFHSSLTTVYAVGVIPCVIPLMLLATALWRLAAARPPAERWAIAGVCLASPLVIRAIHWGHPEDLLCTALCLGALLAAARDRPLVAGLLLGLAYATKQWALVAGLPVLLALPSRQYGRFLAMTCGVALLFMLPMLLGDPDAFMKVQHAAGSGDPSKAFGLRPDDFPAGRTAPQTLWMPFSHGASADGGDYRFTNAFIAGVSHPLILLLCFPLAYPLWRRRPVSLIDALRLLALLCLVRTALDTNNLDYYAVPATVALAALAAVGGRAEFRAMVFGTLGLSLAFVDPVTSLAEQTDHAWLKWAVYMATVIPLGAWLARDLYAPESVPDLKARFANDKALVEVEG